jgi:hypothetical protein
MSRLRDLLRTAADAALRPLQSLPEAGLSVSALLFDDGFPFNS